LILLDSDFPYSEMIRFVFLTPNTFLT
jgi:hypothetical protein